MWPNKVVVKMASTESIAIPPIDNGQCLHQSSGKIQSARIA